MEVNANLYGQDYVLPNYAVYPHDPEQIEQGACRLDTVDRFSNIRKMEAITGF